MIYLALQLVPLSSCFVSSKPLANGAYVKLHKSLCGVEQVELNLVLGWRNTSILHFGIVEIKRHSTHSLLVSKQFCTLLRIGYKALKQLHLSNFNEVYKAALSFCFCFFHIQWRGGHWMSEVSEQQAVSYLSVSFSSNIFLQVNGHETQVFRVKPLFSKLLGGRKQLQIYRSYDR